MFKAFADELNNVFFFGCCQDIAGSERGKGESLQVVHLVEWNQDNGTFKALVFAEDREVFEAAVLPLFAHRSSVNQVAGEFAHVFGCHFCGGAWEIVQQGVLVFFMVGD